MDCRHFQAQPCIWQFYFSCGSGFESLSHETDELHYRRKEPCTELPNCIQPECSEHISPSTASRISSLVAFMRFVLNADTSEIFFDVSARI